MKINRKKNAVHGTIFGIILKLIQIAFPFVIRTVFIHTLGAKYLGLNSLFTAILQVLNLAELGVGSALVFSMYRPIVDDDSEKICQLMSLYRLYYRVIGGIVLVVGLVLIPFLPNLIKGDVPPDINLYVLYMLHLAATVLSYWLFGYRNSLFAAHQRNDVVFIISIVTYLCMYLLQIGALIVFENYYIYLCLAVFTQIVINLITAVFSKKYFPGYKPYGKLPKEERAEINRKVRDLFTAKMGAVINNSADSVVISSFLGLELLAIYQNYYYIISAIMGIFKIFFAACTAGIGNSLIVKTKEQNKKLLYNINHISFFAINYCCACFLCLCQPFIQVWVGSEYQLDFTFVILFALYLFAEEAPRTLIVFKDAGGIWRHDRFRPLIAAAVNVVLNLVLTQFIGLYGIVISTIVSLLFVGYPWLILKINKRLFEIDVKKYVFRILTYVAVVAVSSGVSYLLCNLFSFTSHIVTLIVRLVIASVISCSVFLLVYSRTDENKYVMHQFVLLKKKITRKR